MGQPRYSKNSEEVLQMLDLVLAEHKEIVNHRRAVLMDVMEGSLGLLPNWDFFRKKLLSFLGQSGLEGDFERLIEDLKRNGIGHETRS